MTHNSAALEVSRVECRHGRQVCDLTSPDAVFCPSQAMVVRQPTATEIFARCVPADPTAGASRPRQQADALYECLGSLLKDVRGQLKHVVAEKVYFCDLHNHIDAFAAARLEAYARADVVNDDLPATSYLQQPPCPAGRTMEMQVYAIVVHDEERVRIRPTSAAAGARAKLIDLDGFSQLYVANVNGLGPTGQASPSFRKQSDTMFDRMAEILRQHGCGFPDVLRTWCYLADIDRDYNEFNASRNVFFSNHGVERLPASTGIGAGIDPHGALCVTDLYALLDPELAHIEVMTTPTLNEACDYGSAFSRGMKVTLGEKTILFISGTASVDEQGATVHVDDVRGQIDRMLLNVQELLAPHGAKFDDIVQAATFLKSASYYDLFLELSRQWGLSPHANTIVEADVCRPELLCELEAIAVLPRT